MSKCNRNRSNPGPALYPECRRVKKPSWIVAKLTSPLGVALILFASLAVIGTGLFERTVCACSFVSSERATQWMTAKQFAEEAYPRWRSDNPGQGCPPCLHSLTPYMNQKAVDGYLMVCGGAASGIPNSFGVVWLGQDGLYGTDDDARSWDDRPID